jgi:hypothetical protein
MKWMFLSVGAGVVGFGIGVAACGSVAESGNDGGPPESESPLRDSAPTDLDSSSDGDSGDDVSNANNNGAGCHTIAGSGSSKVCMYSASSSSDAGCASGATLGSCPSAGLYGCCLVSPAGDDGGEVDGEVDGGGATTTATCYYSPDAGAMGGMSALDSCQFGGYQGLPYQWIVMAP